MVIETRPIGFAIPHPAVILLAVSLSVPTVVLAAPSDQPACSPTISLGLEAWDRSIAFAEKLGDKAAAIAREKGRELLLPLLGIPPESVPEAKDQDTTGDIAREVEASRTDPARRMALCVAITKAVGDAKAQASAGVDAGLDALKRAIDGLKSTLPRPAPKTDDGLTRL